MTLLCDTAPLLPTMCKYENTQTNKRNTHITICVCVYINIYSYIFSLQKKAGWDFILVRLFFCLFVFFLRWKQKSSSREIGKHGQIFKSVLFPRPQMSIITSLNFTEIVEFFFLKFLPWITKLLITCLCWCFHLWYCVLIKVHLFAGTIKIPFVTYNK